MCQRSRHSWPDARQFQRRVQLCQSNKIACAIENCQVTTGFWADREGEGDRERGERERGEIQREKGRDRETACPRECPNELATLFGNRIFDIRLQIDLNW